MAMNAVQLIKNFLAKCKGFDRCMEGVKIVSAGNGTCVGELQINESHTNVLGGLHGGFSATLVDVISSCALLTNSAGPSAHVSVDIHMTYLKGASIGDEIIIDAKTLKCGKNLAFLNVEIKNKTNGELLVHGTHTKFILSK